MKSNELDFYWALSSPKKIELMQFNFDPLLSTNEWKYRM